MHDSQTEWHGTWSSADNNKWWIWLSALHFTLIRQTHISRDLLYLCFYYFHFVLPFLLLPSHRQFSRLCLRMTRQSFPNNINSLLHSVCQSCCSLPRFFVLQLTVSLGRDHPPLFASSSSLVTSEQFALSRMTFLSNGNAFHSSNCVPHTSGQLWRFNQSGF